MAPRALVFPVMSKPVFSFAFMLSLLLAFCLHFSPLRGDLTFWRPLVVFLVVIYWLLREPHQLGLGFAWMVGLLLDILASGIPGQRALAMLLCAYVLQLAGERLQHFSVWHQMVVVAVLAVIYQMVVILVYLVAGHNADTWRMFYPVLTTVPLWPLLAWVLSRAYQQD